MVDPPRKALGGSGGERRRRSRITVGLESGYEDPDRQVFLTSRDLSEEAIYLQAPDPPELGQQAWLTLELPGHPEILRLAGRVVRREAGGFAVRFEPEPAQAAQGVLRAFVDRRSESSS